MKFLLDSIRPIPAYQQLLESIQSNKKVAGLGLPRTARLPILALLHSDLRYPVIFLTDRADHALAVVDELPFWTADSQIFLYPEPNPLFYEEASWGVSTRRNRIQALTALAKYHLPYTIKPIIPPIIISSIRALMTRTLPCRDFLEACSNLTTGLNIQLDTLLHHWSGIGYEVTDTVIEPGQFTHRGGILDIWPIAEKSPVRLDFFGDEIEAIRSFDPTTQRTIDKLDAVIVSPAREVLPFKATKLIDNLPRDKLSEFHLPLVYTDSASLFDYLPPRALVLVDDLSMVELMANEVDEHAVKLRKESIAEGILPNDFPTPYLTWSELADGLKIRPWIELGYSTAEEMRESSESLTRIFIPGQRFSGRLKPFIDHLVNIISKGDNVVIASRQSSRLKELWIGQSLNTQTDNPKFLEVSLSGGWRLDHNCTRPLDFITDNEIFGWERPQPRQRQHSIVETPESIYGDLRPFNWVVHVDHGIGRYLGLVRRALEGHEREFLCVEYEGGDELYVPVHQADRLTRYIGSDSGIPSPSRLGGAEWHQTKSRVTESIQQVAEELLDLYARRQVSKGFAFNPDTPWQTEIEASFPYVETNDQLRVIHEVKMDMESPRPMDRLLCGDVGYGKTEVALRAAFKAVMDGKQVAILVPTTVLAQQHYETFLQRLATYPITVEMLSRFRTPREQMQILSRLRQGGLDIIIGTHRLIQPDVGFKDLGLVIIDEEQRFGVTHKEHLKKMRTEVDVLTLTATPIPRTLYMALTGVRDISNLNTPPEERLPIVTHIGPYSPRLVRQAILREYERGGQVFFVHNRVQTIGAMKIHLNKLVPEVRVDIAHGQMSDHELAAVMRRFTNGEVDVLLSTSIIESGLDIPNANTLVVDRGDTFGLAQLYQLRGRVGRGAMRAYAYFFRHRKKPPTIDGQERMEVIAENSQLGAGYSIAMRDLEIRGAGDLLGTRQHGNISAVGFYLYTRLLAQAVRAINRSIQAPVSISHEPTGVPVHVDLPLTIGIPSDYIPDQNLRLRLYRRLADIEDEAELDAISFEFIDRFGHPPEMVQNLFYQIRVKLLAEAAGLSAINMENDQIVLRYASSPEGVESDRLPDLGPGIRAGKKAYWVTYNREDGWNKPLLDVLERLKKVSIG